MFTLMACVKLNVSQGYPVGVVKAVAVVVAVTGAPTANAVNQKRN